MCMEAADTHTHTFTCVSVWLAICRLFCLSAARAQWDINCNMQLNHLCKSQYRGEITFLIKSPWLIVIKVSSVNVSSWLSNSGAGDSKHIPADCGGWTGMGGWRRTYWHTNSFWAHWQPSHNWQLWNTIISVICLRIHQRLHRPVKTFTDSERDREGRREGGRVTQEERRPHWLNEIFILSSRLFTLCYCERIISSVVFPCESPVTNP